MSLIPTTNCIESVTYKGEVLPYTGHGHCYYLMAQRKESIQRALFAFIEPLVECGFDVGQIQAELHFQGQYLVADGQINSIIKQILEA